MNTPTVQFSTYDTDEPRIDREDAFQTAFMRCAKATYAYRRAEETDLHTAAQFTAIETESLEAYQHLCRVIEAFAAVEVARAVSLVASLNRPAPPASPVLFTLKQDCEGLHLFGYEYAPASATDPTPDIHAVSIFGGGSGKPERYDTIFGLMNDLPAALDWMRLDAARSVTVVITDTGGEEVVRWIFENPHTPYPEPTFEYVYPVAVALPVQTFDRAARSPQEGGKA